MSDEMPSRTRLGLGFVGVLTIAVLGFIAFDGPRAADRCRAAVFGATTAYKVEQALRSPVCIGLRKEGPAATRQ